MGILLCPPAPNRSLHNITHCPLHNPLPPIWSSHNLIFTKFVQPQRSRMFQPWQQFPCPQRDSSVFPCKMDMKCLEYTVFAQKLHPAKRQWCPFSKKGVSCRRGRCQRSCVVQDMHHDTESHGALHCYRKRSQLCLADRLKRRGREQIRMRESEEEEGEGRKWNEWSEGRSG